MPPSPTAAGLLLAALLCIPARAEIPALALREPDLSLRLDQPASSPDAPPAEPIPEHGPPLPFGARGSTWLTFAGGLAHDLEDSSDYNAMAAYSIFIEKNVEFAFELNAWYFAQRGDNALGINPAINLRWHFLNEGPWSLYVDGGIGLFAATDEVPEGATEFGFMPRAGGGFTRQINDGGARLQVGLRWHHISNARTFGDNRNPGRDGVMLYAGVMIPW